MFDYIPERPLEPPEDVIVCYCAQCGGEIYEGEEVYEVDGELIHEDCLLDYAKEHFAVKKEASIYESVYC